MGDGPLPDEQMSSASLSPFFFSLPHNSLSSRYQDVLESSEIRPRATHPRRSRAGWGTPPPRSLPPAQPQATSSALGEVCSNGVLWCPWSSPRMIDGDPPQYRNERYARGKKGYNLILTGVAFMDSEFAFKSSGMGRRTVEYVHQAWAIDTSKLSSAAISRDTQKHYDVRTKCLAKFSSIYGPLPQKWEFGRRQDGWDK
ncbi:hypothetical protein ZWY2020_000632 [Hordeum vulgare]|nr:hypothetical protein ZWY2020_000632 [Hordeum vulgare]